MWRRVGLASLSLLALLIVLVVMGTLGLLSYTLLSPDLRVEQGTVYRVLLACLIGAFVAIVLTVLYQTLYFSYTEFRQRRTQQEQEHWSEVWLGVLFDGKSPPRTVDDLGADTLMLIKESLKGDSADQIRDIYTRSGLLARDLHTMNHVRLLERRVRMLERWAVLCDPRTHPTLVEFCSHPHPELRRLALLSLARSMGFSETKPAHVAVTFENLLSLDRFGVGWIEQVLVLLGPAGEQLIQDILQRFPDEMKLRALNALTRLRLVECLPEAVPLLASSNPEMRAAVLRVFGSLRYVPPRAVEKVYRLLEDPVWFVRAQAVLACGGIWEEETAQRLYSTLSDDAWWVRHNSALSLSGMGEPGLQVLRRAAQGHPDVYARDMASQQLFALNLPLP